MLFKKVNRSISRGILSGFQRCPWFLCIYNGWRENGLFLRPSGVKTPTWRWHKILCESHSVLCLVLHFILFSDPRKWSQEEVRQWLIWTSARHSLPIDPARFPMNGKSLCLMSLAMFSYRLPLGGKLLYKDFQLRLTAAFHIEDNLDRHHHQKIIKIIHHWMSSFLVKTK